MLDEIIRQAEIQIAEDTARQHFRLGFMQCMREQQVGSEESIRLNRVVMEASITAPDARQMPDGYELPDDVLAVYQQHTRGLFEQEAERFRDGFARMRELVGIDTAYRAAHN